MSIDRDSPGTSSGGSAPRSRSDSSPRAARAPLRLISKVTDRLVQTLDFDEALEILIDGATELLGVARASIMIIDPHSRMLSIKVARGLSHQVIAETKISLGEGIAGTVAASGRPLVVRDVRELDQWLTSPQRSQAQDYRDFSALSVPLIIHGDVQGVMNFNHKLDDSPLDAGDLELAMIVANQATVALYLAKLHRQYLAKQALDYELRVARSIQQRLQPKHSPSVPPYQFAAHSKMCHEVGGDYYDYVPMNDGRLGIAIGDVAGHGLGPALLVADARACVQSGLRRSQPLTQCLADLNEVLLRETNDEIYMTMLLAALDPSTGTLEFASAGHHLPIILRDGSPLPLPIAGANIPLGIRGGLQFEAEEPIVLHEGDLTLLFTDGIWEATDRQGRRFGSEGIIATLRDSIDRTGDEIIEEILARAAHHRGNLLFEDDCTLMTIQYGRRSMDGSV
jgi:sigma-B regulation protein RsbU (phosphoserine phosphatase)